MAHSPKATGRSFTLPHTNTEFGPIGAVRIIQSLPVWIPRALLTALIFVGGMWLYASTAVPGMIIEGAIGGDAAELQRMANRLGIAHSTGYPIHTLLGYASARLGEASGGDPYTWITYTSALGTAIALALFFQLVLELGNTPAALATTACVMFSNVVWHMSTITEVQGLQTISLVGLLWASLTHLRKPDRFWPLGAMAFFAGLGLANHRMIILALPTVALAFALSGAWRRLTPGKWAILFALAALPLFSYAYIFWRAQDPYVAISTHASWVPSYITAADAAAHISGQGLQGNFVLPIHDFSQRLAYVWMRMTQQLPPAAILSGVIGLIVLVIRRRQVGSVLAVYSVVHFVFLLGWRLDWKGEIYFYVLTIPLVIGIAALAAWPLAGGFDGLARFWRHPALLATYSLPVIALALWLYTANRPARDLSDLTTGPALMAQLARVPHQATVFTGGWEPETFAYLEYLDDVGIHDAPVTDYAPEAFIAAARDQTRMIYAPLSRALYTGGYGPSADYLAVRQGVAFSGTFTGYFIQGRPQLDPRVVLEAEQAEIVHAPIAPGVELYSYAIQPEPDGLRIGVYWHATGPITVGYAPFTHLRQYAPDGEIIALLAQHDMTGPVYGLYPTWLWPTGEIIKDTYFIAWPTAPLPASGLTLTIGMALTDTGERVGEFSIPLQGLGGSMIDFELLGVPVER